MVRSWVHTLESGFSSEKVTIKPVDQQDASAGRGMFVNRAVEANEVICSISAPLVLALDNARLDDTCYNCHSNNQQLANDLFMSHEDTVKPGLAALKTCAGCRTSCQKSSWAAIHKLECSLYAKHSPRVMPNHMRAITRLILMQMHDRTTGEQWDDLMGCPSHIENITATKDEELLKLVRAAHATVEITGTDLDASTVLKIYCILKINAITLMPAWFDPLGLYMHPFLAKLNHSCDPNAYIRFPLVKTEDTAVEVIALRELKRNEEVTISYIEENKPYEMRQHELKRQYFFDCSCPKCVLQQTGVDVPGNPLKAREREMISEIETKMTEAESQDISTRDQTATDTLTQALQQLGLCQWPKQLYPYPQVLQKLIVAYIDEQKYDFAMAYGLTQHFDVDPLVYNDALHPIRLIHHYTLVRLFNYLCDTEGTSELLKKLHHRQHLRSQSVLPWWRSYLGAELRDHARKIYGNGLVLNRIIRDSEDTNPAWPVVKPADVRKDKYDEMSKRIRELSVLAQEQRT